VEKKTILCEMYLKGRNTNMTNDSKYQYGDHKANPKVLMDCIQLTVVIRAGTHAPSFLSEPGRG